MRILAYHCDSCEFAMLTRVGEYRYVITDDDDRETLQHPGEELQILNVLGEDASDELLEQRTGYRAYYVCRGCGHAFEAERDHEPDCSECDSSDVTTQNELVGDPCPHCEEGTFVTETKGIA